MEIRFSLVLTAALFFITATALAQPFTLDQTFDDPTVTDRDEFGFSVALDKNRVLVGAPYDSTHGMNTGQAYLFNAATGNLLHVLDDPTVTNRGLFAWAVALHGNYVLIGAPADDTNGRKTGQAYLFNATTGNLLHTIDDPTNTGRDEFGSSVALHGNRILIGAPHDGTNGSDVGQAYLFDAATGNLLRIFDAPNCSILQPLCGFGWSVAIDEDRVLIGAPGDSTHGFGVGRSHLFDSQTGQLLQTFDDPTPTEHDNFGYSVSLDGESVLIGDPFDDTNGYFVGRAHLFDATTGKLMQTFDDPTATVADAFGLSVALEGDTVVIGARTDDTMGPNVGQAHLFDAATGELLQTLNDPTVTSGDGFGRAVALDGEQIVIGSPFDDTNGDWLGQVHLFTAVPEPSASLLSLIVLICLAPTRKFSS